MTINLDALRRHISSEILNDQSLSIEDDQDLLLSGLIDSLHILKLVSYLEQEYDISIPPEDVLIEHFGTLTDIQDYMSKRTA